jgi:microcystin-dependent protein
MPYQVKFTETTNPAKPSLTVADQSINQETSLQFPGKNYAGYAPIMAENFLHLLENFAKNSAPNNPVQGQLWYDNSAGENILKVYDGTGWTPAGTVKKSASEPLVANSTKGDLWVDTENQQVYVYSGSNWLLIGPQYSSGLKTGPDVETITDTVNVDHSVVSFFADDNRIAVVSKQSFTPKTTIPGFASIGQGINLSTVDSTSSSSPTKFWGTASVADALNYNGTVVQANNFLRGDKESTTTFPLNVNNNQGISIGSNRSFNISTDANSTILSSLVSGNYIEFKLNNAGSTVTAVHIDANGFVGVGSGNTNPQQALDVAGNIITDGDLIVQGTTDATVLGQGSIQTNGGLSVNKQSQFGGDVSINGGIHFNNLDLNGDPTAGTVIQPASDDATDLYDLGTSTRRFRNIYAQSFVGSFNGAFTGSLSGNISGSAAKLASPTRFQMVGDVETTLDVIFDGQLPQGTTVYGTTPSGYQRFFTSVTQDIITAKDETTDSFLTDSMLIYRSGTGGGLKQVTKSNFISNIPTVPVGAIFPYAGATPPAGYLLCDGSELPIGTYSDLYSVILYTYKPPSQLVGKATFALPDLRGRFALGRDNMQNIDPATGLPLKVPAADDPTIDIPAGGGSANRVTDVVADTLGAGTNTGEYKTLSVSNLPDHKHNLNSGYAQYYAAGLPGAGADPGADPGLGSASGLGSGLRNSGNVISPTIGQPFNAMNPYLTINYIIFTGVI